MAQINKIRVDPDNPIYGYEDQKTAFRCTNGRAVIKDVTELHFERFRTRDGLVKMDVGDSPVAVLTQKNVRVMTTERWLRDNKKLAERFGYRLEKSTAGTDRKLKKDK